MAPLQLQIQKHIDRLLHIYHTMKIHFLKYGGIFPKYDTYLHIYTSDNIYRTKNNLSRPRMRCNCMRSEFIEYFDYDIELDFDPEEVEFIVSGRYKNKYSGELCYVEHHECVFELLN